MPGAYPYHSPREHRRPQIGLRVRNTLVGQLGDLQLGKADRARSSAPAPRSRRIQSGACSNPV